MAATSVHEAMAIEGSRRQAVERCRTRLAREGWTVSLVVGGPPGRVPRLPDLLAATGGRVVRVLVLTEPEVDAPETRARVRAALAEGETRLWVPWPLRWRAVANLARWRLEGASVHGW